MRTLVFIFIHLFFHACMASAQNTEAKLQEILNKSVDEKKIFGTTVSIQKGDGSFSWTGSAGDLQGEDQYFIASTTKLYVTAIILKLREEGKLSLKDKISKYLSQEIMHGLHVYNGEEYSQQITITHLLAHTSGLPDYFEQKKANGKSLYEEIVEGNDQSWDFESALELAKQMKPKFKPGEKGKALYADTNFQLLGRIIEEITGKSIAEAFDTYIFQVLGLSNTYLYTDPADARPASMYFKNQLLPIPLAMSSFGPDGGIVSTTEESMIFIKAFFSGQLFPKAYLAELSTFNKIFYPLQSGIGIHRFKLPRIFTLFKAMPEWLGHSGLSGAFAYYCPEKDLFFTGTVNQINYPGSSFQLMIKLLNKSGLL